MEVCNDFVCNMDKHQVTDLQRALPETTNLVVHVEVCQKPCRCEPYIFYIRRHEITTPIIDHTVTGLALVATVTEPSDNKTQTRMLKTLFF